MKNHFFFSYSGNKRDEVETIHDALKNNLKNITTIIEPFCGSSAFSFYIASLYPGRVNYILNDNNKYLI
jgi:site-specific DNA-adenine methylase